MNRLKNVYVYNCDMQDYNYIVFLLGRDLIYNKLKYNNGDFLENGEK